MTSCNNGEYDANPKVDHSGILNPLDTSIPGIVYIGTMKGYIDGGNVLFSPAYYTIDAATNTRTIFGMAKDDTVFWRTISLTVSNDGFGSKKDDTLTNAVFTYSVYDTVRKVHKKYIAMPTDKDTFNAVIRSNENNVTRGVFSGRLRNVEPILPVPDPNDTVTFKAMNFYVEKK
eukprot:TRINITY_DN67297_c0_g1_i1.p1 TRINITY_DN67297_c0_g1~~TRINITY_DN67297_c0_g1_i1.p1  ORF type:complete len:190 (-),score=9.14 TRINITY_DN67297_c0_g1_i1:8-529(-)